LVLLDLQVHKEKLAQWVKLVPKEYKVFKVFKEK
jgi:hypothetical protein